MSKWVVVCLLLLSLSPFAGRAFAGNSKIDIAMTAETSTVNNFVPTLQGQHWVYAIDSPIDVFPITFSRADSAATTPAPPCAVISIDMSSDLNPYLAAPDFPITLCAGQTVTTNISLDATALPPGEAYVGVIHFKVDEKVFSPIDKMVKIQLTPAATPYTCYVSDSSGNKLFDCAGKIVDTFGRFDIVGNGRRVVATNPGQFYYNLIYANTTTHDQELTLALTEQNAVPVGANSVHALTYSPTEFTASFDLVNQQGIPCGQTGGGCPSLTVPAGQRLWLTWHVAYEWIGAAILSELPPASACGAITEKSTILLQATLSAGDAVVADCGTTANGYIKK